jgi:hypothetical protein
MRDQRYRAYWIPTLEEQLDVDFWAIVSDCRAIIAGTLTPRPWSELASTWIESPREVITHRTEKTKKKCSASATIRWAKRPRPLNRKLSIRHEKIVRKMVRLLVLNGQNEWDAVMQARAILK